MTVLTDIIQVQISRETQAVSRAAFNIPLFIAEHTAFAERSRVYTSLAGVAEDFNASDAAYIAATKYFGQEVIPSRIVIGRKQINSVTGSILNVQNNTNYSLTINDVTVTVNSGASATDDAIVTALVTAVEAESAITGVNVVDNEDGSFTASVATPGANWSIKGSLNVVIVADESTEEWADALSAVEASNNEWIALNVATKDESDILSIAAAIEAREKVFITSTSAANVKTASEECLASQLKSLGYQKTAVYWKADAASYPECAITGYLIQANPGSNTWAYKTLTGVATDRLSATESTNLKNKNVNTYESIGGVNSTTGGKMAGGEFIDVMLGVLWLTARMRERIWFRMVNTSKIAYTNAGIAIIEAEVRAQLAEGVRNNFLADAPAPVVSVPDALNVDPNLRATRTLEDLRFEARLAGAIHFVKIQGSVFV